MRSLQPMKQLELNLGPVAETPPSHRFEEFIASHLSESPTGQIRLMESICEEQIWEQALYLMAMRDCKRHVLRWTV